jgi:UDP-3-O-[3-hydroxymyristoyl] glucosamine N-acyltransferase
MRLSEISNAAGVAVWRDGDFQTLGFLCDTYANQLVFLESRTFSRALERNRSVSAVLTTPELTDAVPDGVAVGVCDKPRIAFANLHNELALRGFYWDDFATVIHPAANVHPTAWVDECNVRIGAGTDIGPKAAVLQRSLVGDNVVIGAGAILGGVGFQTVRSAQPMIEMTHAGGLVVESRARILPGAVIATGLFRQNTLISEDARVGSNAFVSHGVDLGARVFVGHGAVLNGNVAVGADSWIGPGAIVSQNLRIGENAFVSLGSVVIRNIADGAHVSGNFAVPHRRQLRMVATLDPAVGG